MATDTITRYLVGMAGTKDAYTILRVVAPIADRMSSQMLTTAGLVIKAGGGVLTKTGAAACYGTASGKLVTIAASTDMPALTGNTITANSFNVFCFFIDSASVVTLAAGTQATTIAGIVWPQFPVGKAMVGALLVTHSATFTGNTTALDTATTVYLSPIGPFDPTVLV